MNGERAKQALDRIFDNCEEIDTGEDYDMYDDVKILGRYIRSHNEPVEWELVFHDDVPDYYARWVTARCNRCKHWYRVGSEKYGEQYGKKLSSVFYMGSNPKKHRVSIAYSIMDYAEKQVSDLPHFCENCGARMKGVRWDYDSFKPLEETA